MRLIIQQTASGDSGQVLFVSRLRAVSRRMGFSDVTRERMDLVCKEIMTNQTKFAKGTGFIQLWEVTGPTPALDVFALDYGPGIADLDLALEDGFTTAHTMGKGLGAIRRLAHESDFYTLPAGRAMEQSWHGTAVWVRFYVKSAPLDGSPRASIGCYLRAYQDAQHNGDVLAVRRQGSRMRWMHLDGLGHGREAAHATTGATDLLEDDAPLEETMRALHARLAGGRGAVALLGEADSANETVSFCGVGDMAAIVVSNGEKKSVSFAPGVVGHEHRTPEVVSMPFPKHALVISASDGLRRTWGLGAFPGLWRLRAPMVAMVLGELAGRSNDDKSVFVINANQQR